MKVRPTGIGLQLHWIQPSMWERHFELYSENSLLGELRFEPGGTAYGALTIAGSATKRWTFKVTGGILKPRVTIRETGTNNDLAVYWYKRGGVDGWSLSMEASFTGNKQAFWEEERASIMGTRNCCLI